MAYDVSRALLSAYRNGIRRFQRLLKTHQTDVEQSYIKERLLSCKAAVTALNGFSRPYPNASIARLTGWAPLLIFNQWLRPNDLIDAGQSHRKINT